MTEEIIQASRESAALLESVRTRSSPMLREELSSLLQRAVEIKLGLPSSGEENIRNLIVQSIRLKSGEYAGLPPGEIRRAVEKYDCHQTSLVAKKKVLLFFFLEEKLGLRLEDAQVARIETISQLSDAVSERLLEAGEEKKK